MPLQKGCEIAKCELECRITYTTSSPASANAWSATKTKHIVDRSELLLLTMAPSKVGREKKLVRPPSCDGSDEYNNCHHGQVATGAWPSTGRLKKGNVRPA